MKTVFGIGFFVLFAAISHGSTLQSETEPSSHEIKTYLTRLDHFRPQDRRVARFTYTQKADHYRLGGPIYVFINDGGLFTTEWLDTGLMHDIAMETGALLITSANRYFRENLPTDSASFENLEYLTLEQSMADVATLVSAVLLEFPYSSRVILWGSGFGGTLAAMTRQKYPHLINGVWSSSGIFSPGIYITDTFLHMESVIRDIGGEQCADRIASVFNEMNTLIYSEEGEELGNIMHHCTAVNVTSDLSLGAFIQNQIDFFTLHFNNHHHQGLLDLCEAIDTDAPALNAWADWVAQTFLDDIECFDFGYYSRVELASRVEWDQPGTISGMRQWYYYKCTQVGLWETTSNYNEIFPHHVRDTYHYYLCNTVLGPAFDAALLYDNTNALRVLYGALNPRVTNVIYTNGLMDNWFPRGMQDSYPGGEVINIPNFAKSGDLTSLSDSDDVNMRNAKLAIQESVTEWGRL